MCRLKDGCAFADIASRRQPQPTNQPGTQVGEYISVEVRCYQHIELPRIFHQLHCHVVHQPVFKLNIRVSSGYLTGNIQKQPVGELHNVGFMHSGYFFPVIISGIFKSKLHDAAAVCLRNHLDAEAGIRSDGACTGFGE